ncbi:metalloregulator ArsR/SmtB family transcription factor [bacterium]|nr:metalloregulator ArsR/SmtB family transcription factor [bacterium]
MSESNFLCDGDHNLAAFAENHLLDESLGQNLAELFKALSDPTRVRIIGLLAHAEMCVGDICLMLDKSQPLISHQLRLLRQAKLVKVRRAGQHAFYTLADDHIHTLFHQGLDHVKEA